MEEINLKEYRGNNSTMFTGRPQGEHVREKLGLDSLDKKNVKVCVIIPKGTTSFNPSFFLGLFYDSYSLLGEENFKDKYLFEYKELESEYIDLIKEDIDNGIRHARNSQNKNKGFKSIFG